VWYIVVQPTRLNVVKNDSDTWDYTNPNLGNLLFCIVNEVSSGIQKKTKLWIAIARLLVV